MKVKLITKKWILFLAFSSGIVLNTKAQNIDSLENKYQNSADKLLNNDAKLSIGGYGEAHFNQSIISDTKTNGLLDLHRIVLFFGYNFSKKTQFITEVEFEHAKELWVEQAFLQHKFNNYIQFRAGLLLIPMGIINEYHEPTTFNGVERSAIDNKISPSTWREIGFGFSGNIMQAALKYQVYLVNGFNGYDGTALFSGSKGLRDGRQKGAETYMSSPNYTGKIEYYGLKGLNIGLSGYFGNSQSKLYNNLYKASVTSISKADSSYIGISMIGFDTRYKLKALELRGQIYYTGLSNTAKYNEFTKKAGKLNDLGSSMIGYYIEAGYNIFRHYENIKSELIPFVRYQAYNTHNSVENNITKNIKYNSEIITAGLTWKIVKGAVLKADIDLIKTKADSKFSKVFNAGFGVMF